MAGMSVAPAGDVNGDGRPDVIVGAPGYDTTTFEYRFESGAAFVIFGRATLGTVNLSNLGSDGFAIYGERKGELAGSSVAGAGDVNGDGRADVVVGSPQGENFFGEKSGAAFVIFGGPEPSPRSRRAREHSGCGLQDRGRLHGGSGGLPVAGLGDVNGDGRSDIAVGANQAGDNGELSGSVYVVFGKVSTGTVVVTSLGRRGYEIQGPSAGALAGWSVAGLGDVSGDARPDLVVGAPQTEVPGRQHAGAAYVVFGKASTTRSG